MIQCAKLDTRLLERDTAEVATELERALMSSGYLVLTDDTTEPSIDTVFDTWTKFLKLPNAIKERCRRPESSGRKLGGWLLLREAPVYLSHMDESELAEPTPKQQFACSPDVSATEWPTDAECPGFRHAMQTCARDLDRMARALLSAFEYVLGARAGFLRYDAGYLAVSGYPGHASNMEVKTSALQAHSDATVFTLLSQRKRALQLEERDGSWSDAPQLSGGDLLLLPGDWMELWTNGAIPAVRHRVLDTPYSRESLVYFQSVAPMEVGPLERFVTTDNPARYPTVKSDIQYSGGQSGVPRWRTHVSQPETPNHT